MMKFLMFICLLFAVMQTSWAQFVGTPYIGYVAKPAPPSSTMGNDFWLTFENNAGTALGSTGNSAAVALVLNIASQLPTTVTISFTTNNNSYTYNLAANVSRRISLDSMKSDGSATVRREDTSVYLSSEAGVYPKTMHITSTQPIAVYAFNTASASTDATIVYPVAAWGTDYYQVAYVPNGISNEIIIANQDNTVITLYNTDGSFNSTQTLGAGQVYVTNGGSTDITGRHFTSSNPVAYFAGATLFNVPTGVDFADVFDEQMMPAKTWDEQYFVPNAQQGTLSTNNRIRVVASQNNTVVNYAGASLPTSFSTTNTTGNNQILSGGTLSAGQWVELSINNRDSGAYITANNPIGVAGYLVSAGNSTSNGDPDNAIMPGLHQMIQQVTISPFMFPLTNNLNYTVFDQTGVIHGAIIVTKKENKDSVIMTKGSDPTNLLIGGTWIDDANGSGMSIYRYTFNNINDIGSSFTISSLANGGGVIVLGYGIGNAESYYYNAGSGAYSLQ